MQCLCVSVIVFYSGTFPFILQSCFVCVVSKEGDIPSAASAAAVYHYYHPNDDLAAENLALYNQHAQVAKGDLDVQDNIEYIDFWKKGVAAYHGGEYEEMVKYMEMSLQALLLEIERCQSLCKGLMKNTKTYFFAEAMSERVIDVLKCQYNCPQSLGEFRDDSEESSDFLTLYFHYLAYGYLQSKQTNSPFLLLASVDGVICVCVCVRVLNWLFVLILDSWQNA